MNSDERLTFSVSFEVTSGQKSFFPVNMNFAVHCSAMETELLFLFLVPVSVSVSLILF